MERSLPWAPTFGAPMNSMADFRTGERDAEAWVYGG